MASGAIADTLVVGVWIVATGVATGDIANSL